MHVVVQQVETPTSNSTAVQNLQHLDRVVFPTQHQLSGTELAQMLSSRRTLLLVAAASTDGTVPQSASSQRCGNKQVVSLANALPMQPVCPSVNRPAIYLSALPPSPVQAVLYTHKHHNLCINPSCPACMCSHHQQLPCSVHAGMLWDTSCAEHKQGACTSCALEWCQLAGGRVLGVHYWRRHSPLHLHHPGTVRLPV
jgi:hypothetical protein